MSARSTKTKCYLVQVDMDLSETVAMSNYEVYHSRWHIRQYKDFNKHPTMGCHFWPDIIMKNQDVTLGMFLPVRKIKVHSPLQKNHIYLCLQY